MVMQNLLEWLSHSALQMVDSMGVLGIFIGMMLESACIPIPSEVIMLSGGFLIAEGSFSFPEVIAAGVLGNLLGSITAYYVGAKGGRALLERYGKYIFFKTRHFEQAQRWFQHHGESTVFFTRNLPFIRTFISLPAGIAGMSFGKFVLFTLLGCLPWNIALTYLGFRLGASLDVVERYLHPVSYAVAAVLLVLLVLWLFRKKREAK